MKEMESQTKTSLKLQAYQYLKTKILNCEYRPNEFLNEQKLCAEMGNISRTPMRDALGRLEQEGLIEMIPNRGAFVTGFGDQDVADMYEMRKVYEVLAFEWAVERITPEELEEIKNAYELMEFYTHKKEYEKTSEQNTHFHELIYKASHNRLLTQILTSYQYYTKQFKVGSEANYDHMDDLLEEHYEILQSLETKDAKRGMAVIKKHLEGSKERAGYGGFKSYEV